MCDDFQALDQTINHHIEQGTLTVRQWQAIKRQFAGARCYFGETEISRQNDYAFIKAQLKAGARRRTIAERLASMNHYSINTAYGRINEFLNSHTATARTS